MSYKNNKFKIPAPTWNGKFELPDGSYPISGFQDYFEYIIKKHEALTVNLPITIYVKKIKNRITFFKAWFRTWFHLKLLTSETMKLLGSTKN